MDDKKIEVRGTLVAHWTARVWPGTSPAEIIECVMAAGPWSGTQVSLAPLGTNVSDGPWVEVRWRYGADDVEVVK